MWTIEDRIAFADTEKWGNLRNSNVVRLEIANHLVGFSADCVTGSALSLAEKDRSASFHGIVQGIILTPRQAIDRCVGIDLHEFKFSVCPPMYGKSLLSFLRMR